LYRTKLGYSQESFAEAVGLHRNYIGAIERGERNLSLQNLIRIAVALKLPLSTLIAEAEKLIRTDILSATRERSHTGSEVTDDCASEARPLLPINLHFHSPCV
jgi:transcriptional regulator with XRE-family HTH domain